jgi:hypothetical protein
MIYRRGKMAGKTLFMQPTEFFSDAVKDALKQRKISSSPLANEYLVKLLTHYIFTDNLFDETSGGKKTRSTLAELYLKAMNAEPSIRADLLKKLGDTSLYISGFFSESLNRKVVDLSYYVNMGETAFHSLSTTVNEEAYSDLFKDFSKQFVKYMDVLNYISQQANLQNNSNLLKLYENYQKTGSDLIKETLIDSGFVDFDTNKKSQAQ